MNKKIKVLFVAAEVAPIAKVGGLADVVGSLPDGLSQVGILPVIALPYYEFLKKDQRLNPKLLLEFDVEWLGKKEKVKLFSDKLPGSRVKLYLYQRAASAAVEIYGSAGMSRGLYLNPKDDLERFVFFSLAVAESLPKIKDNFSVIHCHDWHTGLVPFLLRQSRYKTVLTIHNLANQGQINSLLNRWLGQKSPKLPVGSNQHNLLGLGIEFAQKVNTVSPNYAREILTKEFGCGLEKTLEINANKLSGIVNGIDVKFFNPSRDKHIAKKFDVERLGLKKLNKTALQLELGLENNPNLPLLGLVSRFVGQKGLDLFDEKIFSLPAQFVFLGEGDPEIEKSLAILAEKHKKSVKVIKGFDLALAQRIYAASDFFLMPSRFEPCGLGQLIAFRYGSLPIVRLVGGLKDTVPPSLGFGFIKASSRELEKAIKNALTVFYAQPKKLETMRQKAMKNDYSWQKSALKYQKIYKKLANIK
jgi:starch synthase